MSDSISPLLTQAAREEVQFGPYRYLVPGGVQRQGLGRFASKITIGDYGLDSDELLSAWIQSSWQGGMGARKLRAGTDDDEFWDATLETRAPQMLSLLAETVAIAGPAAATAFFPLGDFPAAAPMFWGAFDTQVAQWDALGGAFVAKGDPLPAAPVGKALEWRDLLHVPLGPAGYATVAADGTVTVDSTIPALAFAFWTKDDHAQMLFALTTDGHLRMQDTTGAWAVANEALRLPSGHVPRGLVPFLNQKQEPTLHLVTNRGVWAYDADVPKLYPTHLQFPAHPAQGKASCNWRGDAMFVSVGIGIHRYNGATISAMGPDGRYGLPAGLRGTIVDLEPEYNNLLALIAGEGSGDVAAPETIRLGLPLYRDTDLTISVPPVKSCLLRWTEQGWHKVWESADATGRPTWALVSIADGGYRLWWGYGGEAYTQTLPVDFFNAETAIQVGTGRFARTGALVTGWFDAGMSGFDKLASHVEVTLDDPLETGEPMGSVTVYYQTDTARTWTLLGQANQCGRTVLPCGVGPHPTIPGATFSYGLPFRRIRFRYDVARDEAQPAWSPLVSVVNLKFIKVPLTGQEAFQMTVDLTRDLGNQGIEALRTYLFAAIGSEQFIPMVHRNREYRVRVAQTQGQEATGRDERGSITLNVVGVPVPTSQVIDRAAP